MKKALSLLSLAVLTVGLLGSCSKINERIDGLDQRVGNIEQEKIASIENQIAAINSSIADLGAIRQDILDLQVAVGAKGEDITELKAADEALGQRIDELKAYVGDLSKYAEKDWVTATFATLEQLKTTNTELGALKETVGNLGETFDGKLSDLKTKLTDAINTAVSGINATISTLEGRVAALEAMIQSVSITPAYSDGSVEADENGILTLKCIVSPAEALIGMKSLKDSLLLYADSVKVKTKATTPADMTIEVSEASVLDAAQGAITLTADISEYLPKGEDKALTVAVNIKNGISDFTTEFVPVTLPVSVSLDKHSIVVPFSTTSRDTILKATVENSTKGVTWTSSNTNIATVDANGKVTINANASGKDTIVVKTVEGNATDTCFVTVLPQGTLPGVFSVSATKKVCFSPGNLVATINATGAPTAWKFSAHQYEYIGANVANTKIGKEAGDVDLFGWSTSTDGGASTTDNYGIKTSFRGSDYSGDFYDWGKAVGDGNTWRTLSKDEWTYLLDTRTMTNSKARYCNAINGVTIGGTTYKGVFLYPDDYNGEVVSSSMTWDEINAAGIVFLPAAGKREGSSVNDVGTVAHYWSSTVVDTGNAYHAFFDSGEVVPGSLIGRDFGCSVRLITESN